MNFLRSFWLSTALLASTAALAQTDTDTTRTRLINQYESPVPNAQIIAYPSGKNAQSDAEGYFDSTLVLSDSLRVSAAEHVTETYSRKELADAGKKITLSKSFTWKDLLNPMYYIINGGLLLLLFIVFAETGLFAGFFLPGDSLLFVAGIYSGNLGREFLKWLGLLQYQNEWFDLIMLVALISLAGILGNMVGYWFGRKSGPYLFQRKDTFFFRKKYLYQARDFYEKHGGGAIIFARFLPLVRTFAPIVAGIVNMERKKFMFFNIVGSFIWVFSLIFAGHFLYKVVLNQFHVDLRKHLEVIVLVIVAITTLPVAIKMIWGKVTHHEHKPDEEHKG